MSHCFLDALRYVSHIGCQNKGFFEEDNKKNVISDSSVGCPHEAQLHEGDCSMA